MKIQIWSDFKCPFCFVGKKNLENALKQIDMDVELEMMSFELDPAFIAEKGVSVHESLARKYKTSVEKAKEMNAQISERAVQVGLSFDMDSIIDANTFKAHRVLQIAKEKSLDMVFTELAMSAYFEKGLDLESEEVLFSMAEQVGLSKDDVKKALTEDEYALKVRQDQQWARGIGVRGVPHFVFDDKVSVSGAQPVETFIEAIKYTKNLSNQQNADMCEDDNCSI